MANVGLRDEAGAMRPGNIKFQEGDPPVAQTAVFIRRMKSSKWTPSFDRIPRRRWITRLRASPPVCPGTPTNCRRSKFAHPKPRRLRRVGSGEVLSAQSECLKFFTTTATLPSTDFTPASSFKELIDAGD